MAKKKNRNLDYKPEDIRFENQTIVQSDLVQEMKTSYIDYAMSVIVGRALPDVRDGLKPVHRRILYSMYETGLTHDKKYKKSATCVGDVLGKYHPHGDASVYDAMVRLAQDFSMRYMLVDGKGNFGSVDGDPPAAYRYTEARMSKMCAEMLRDIEKDTVDWDPNFDESLKEPRVLPSRFPNLLVNGSSGIAVGMATNIPPHNLTEVISAAIHVLDDPEATCDDLMEYIKGPDFPTRGIILGRSGIRQAYNTGRGHIRVRARAEFEAFGNGRTRIIVTELPYQVNKRTVLFCPEDLMILKAGASSRRRLMDDALCQLRPKYEQYLTEYGRVLEHKSRILKDWHEDRSLLELLPDFNLRLCRLGTEIIHARAGYLEYLGRFAADFHREFSGKKEDLQCIYRTVSSILDPKGEKKEIFESFSQHMHDHWRAELESGQCLSGPHKDDFEVLLGGVSLKSFGSQGQTRTAAISLKLSQREIFRQDTGEEPVLLLDDVLSELDAGRQDFVLNHLKSGQVFITCCEKDRLTDIGKEIFIEKGSVKPSP